MMTQAIARTILNVDVTVDVEQAVFDAQDEAGRHVVMDMGAKLGLPGGQGTSPRDLLLMALAACSGASFLQELRQRGKTLHSVSIRMTGELAAERPLVFRKIGMHFTVSGRDLDEASTAAAIHACHDGCSVHATLSHVADITTTYEVTRSRVAIAGVA